MDSEQVVFEYTYVDHTHTLNRKEIVGMRGEQRRWNVAVFGNRFLSENRAACGNLPDDWEA